MRTTSPHTSGRNVEPSAAPAMPGATLRGRPVQAVLFDLDGTLVETDDAAVTRLARGLQPLAVLLPGRNVQRAARRLAGWINDRFNGGLAALDWLHLDRPAQRLARRWGLIHENSPQHPLTPVSGTVELVQALYGRYLLGIVSTRSEAEVQVYLAQHGLAGCFAIVVGYDTTVRIKPHAQPIRWAAGRLGVDVRHVLMVGDTAADVRAAKAAGALAVGVLCGFGDRADLKRADLVLTSTADLAEWL